MFSINDHGLMSLRGGMESMQKHAGVCRLLWRGKIFNVLPTVRSNALACLFVRHIKCFIWKLLSVFSWLPLVNKEAELIRLDLLMELPRNFLHWVICLNWIPETDNTRPQNQTVEKIAECYRIWRDGWKVIKDIFILCLAFSKEMSSNLYMKCSTCMQNRTRYLDISKLASATGDGVCQLLKKFNSSYILLKIHLWYLWTSLFLSNTTIRSVYECMVTSNFQFSWIRFRFSATVDFRDLMTYYDLINHIICIMIFEMYGGELDEHFGGSFVTICWKVMTIGLFMLPLPIIPPINTRVWTNLQGRISTVKLIIMKRLLE